MNCYQCTLFSTLLFLCIPLISLTQTHDKELQPGYYVVVAAYSESKEELARVYKDKLRGSGHEAFYGFNTAKGLYFVYLNFYTNLKEGLQSMTATRKKGVFTDAWVRVVPGIIQIPEAVGVTNVVQETQSSQSPVEIVSQTPASAASATDTIVEKEEVEEEIVQYDPMTLGNTEVFLSLYNGTNNRIIDGEIEVIDTERSKSIQKVKGHEYMILPDPKSKSGQLTFIADVFGYRKIQHEINYKAPLADTTSRMLISSAPPSSSISIWCVTEPVTSLHFTRCIFK